MRCCLARCAYLLRTPACTEEDRYLPYLSLYVCASPAAQLLLLAAAVAWLLLLFFCLSEAAETFLVPAVEVRGLLAMQSGCKQGLALDGKGAWSARSCMYKLSAFSASKLKTLGTQTAAPGL